jgi:DNA-binding SARP family transcriptional activator
VKRRGAQVVRGLGAVSALVALLVGPPLLFASLVGWPLPTSIPDTEAIGVALRSGVSDDVIVRALAVLGWVAWLQVAVAILVELAAVARHRPSVRLPVLPGLQGLAGRLVASVMMMTAAVSPSVASAAPAPPAPIVAYIDAPTASAEVLVPAAAPAPEAAMDEMVPSTTAVERAATVTVERHDSYWAIAERALGNGYRWREIRDLNLGRTMNTGHVIGTGSDLVLAGWELYLPGEAPTASTPGSPPAFAVEAPRLDLPGVDAPASGPAEVVVEPGDSFWTLAEEQIRAVTGGEPTDVETAPYWQTMIAANEDRLVQAGNPSIIVAGQHVVVPPVVDAAPVDPSTPAPLEGPPTLGSPVAGETESPAENPGPLVVDGTGSPVPQTDPPDLGIESSAPTTAAPTTDIPTSTPRRESAGELDAAEPATGDDRSGTATSTDSEGSRSRAQVVPVAAGLVSAALAAGATRAIRRRRIRAMRRTLSPEASPPSPQAALHRALVIDADHDGVDALRTTLAALARDLAEIDADVRPRIAQHGAGHLDLVMDHTATAPSGWTALDAGHLWTLDEPPSADADSICAAPLLVTLGQPDSDGQLYLDLEAEHVVSLSGDRNVARSVARAMLAELALTPLADTLEVLVVGDVASPESAGLDHVTHVASWDDVAGDLTAWVEQSHVAVAENGWPNSFIGRGTDPYHDALAPIVAVASQPPPQDLLDQICRYPLATLALVAVGDIEAATVIECQTDRLTIVDLGLECTPYPMEPETLDTIVDLVHDPDEAAPPAEPGSQLPLVLEPSTDSYPDSGIAPQAEPSFDILVRVLGDIRVDGGDPLAAKQTAVVTYIALHRTVSADKLEYAVWAAGTSTSRRKRLANTISECRAALGRHHFPPASDGRYRAGPGIATDVDLFDHRVRRAAGQAPADAADTLLGALELVSGPLFTYRAADRASFAWVEVENWISIWELKVAAGAQRCADLLLDLGRIDEAVDTAVRILGTMPTHTALTETLMRAHAANGDRLAVRRVYEEHLRALAILDLDAPEDSTSSLLETLVGTRSA